MDDLALEVTSEIVNIGRVIIAELRVVGKQISPHVRFDSHSLVFYLVLLLERREIEIKGG